jgi:Fibronectin type III domain
MQTNGFNTRTKLRLGLAAVAAAATAALAVASVDADSPRAASAAKSRDTCGSLGKGRKVRIATAKLIVEYNATDRDIGVHGAFDDHGWKKLCVYDPTGRLVLKVGPKSKLKRLTMAGIFFESREPPIREFSFRDLKARFPEGRYKVRAVSFDGKRLVGSAKFTHDVPRKPRGITPRDGATVDPRNLTVTWNDVTRTVDGDRAKITGYEVIVTKEVEDDPHGFSRPTYDVHVPADRNSLSVPAEFLEPGTKYELEVLALEKSGNQTIGVSFFKTP